MDTIEVHSLIKKIVDILVEKYQPEKIILFGSYAGGTYTEDSDIDILIHYCPLKIEIAVNQAL